MFDYCFRDYVIRLLCYHFQFKKMEPSVKRPRSFRGDKVAPRSCLIENMIVCIGHYPMTSLITSVKRFSAIELNLKACCSKANDCVTELGTTTHFIPAAKAA